jgi:hypothetical protein
VVTFRNFDPFVFFVLQPAFTISTEAQNTMAPLQRRSANLSLQGTVAVIVLVVLFLSGVFCTIIFFKICSKQRRRERAMRRMQEERTPFVGAQYIAPAGAPSNGDEPPYAGQEPLRTELQNKQQYEYTGPSELQNDQENTGPLELQGGERPEPLPAQQLDGYVAAVGTVTGIFVVKMESLTGYSQLSMTANPLNYPRM